jgi:hypothetical protein
MDAAGLTILLKELEADCEVARSAAKNASILLEGGASGHLEACAYELGRLYNVIERMLERVWIDFENHFEKRGDYHERLLQRLSLDLPGVRPAFLPKDQLPMLRELKGFWHLMRHAYDLVLRADRLAELSQLAKQLSGNLPSLCRDFVQQVRVEQGWQ